MDSNATPARSGARRIILALLVVLGLLLPFLTSAASAQARTGKDTRVISLWLCKHRASYLHTHRYLCTHPAAARRANLLAARAASVTPHKVAPKPAPRLVTKPAAASPVIGTATERSIAWAVDSLINRQRAAHGLGWVRMNMNLCLSAHRHNLTMARFNSMSHQLPGEPDFGRREDAAGYHWTWAGENIAWNSDISVNGVLLLQNLMYNEKAPNDGHRQNILNPHYRAVGVDVYIDWAHHKIWLTTDFGSR